MMEATIIDSETHNGQAVSLFDSVTFPLGAYCEAFSSAKIPRDHWRPVVTELDAAGGSMLAQRQDRAKRMRHEDGATYNPFNDPSGKGTPYALDTIPLTLTATEWAGLEAGLIQRAQLLEQILADVYGPQNLMRFGRMPSELIFANPHFLRACHGIQPTGNRFLTFYAVDVYRDPAGNFKVLRDYGANPCGLGYALENRIVISRVLSQLYHHTQIRRLAPFFQTFHRSLAERSSLRGADPGIVLLSPGPDSRIYFEHALLSRYLGYPLVEGQDLTVRNGEVFLKKLAGLEPVEVIFRHVGDDASDPFALRRETASGVAGLIQVSREQNIDIVNPIGAGFVDTPVLATLLPSLCQQLLGQDLLLENHSSWWCGHKDGAEYVRANGANLTLMPALDRSMTMAGAKALESAMGSAPYNYMAREPVYPSVVPALSPNGMTSHYTLMRIFVCATQAGFEVMPGGLAVTAENIEDLLCDVVEKQKSKDIWVLSDRPVEPFSMMESLKTVSEFKRGSDLPSRVADNLLWLGRYLERAEGMIRLLRAVYRRLAGEARYVDISELPFLLNLLKARHGLIELIGDDQKLPASYSQLSDRLITALYGRDQAESVAIILKRVQGVARNVRDRLSLDSWRVINRLENFTEKTAGDPIELLDNTLFTLNAFSGLAMESITRGLGWRFMDMGRRLERAMHQTSLIGIGLPRICTESRSTMEALLEVSDSLMTYRARYRTVFQPAPVLDLLLIDESNPKSLAFQFNKLVSHIEKLPRQSERRFAEPEERIALEMLTAVRLLDLTGLACQKKDSSEEPLVSFLEKMDVLLNEFSQHISAHYLTRVPTIPHFSTFSGGGNL